MKSIKNTIKVSRSQKAANKAAKESYAKFKFKRREGVGGFFATGSEKDSYDFCFYNQYGELEELLPDVCMGNIKYKLDGKEFYVGINESWSCYNDDYETDYYSIKHKEGEDHGWIYEAVCAAGIYEKTPENLNKLVEAAYIMDLLYKEYGHECWYKYKVARLAILECGISEQEVLRALPYINYEMSWAIDHARKCIKSFSDLIFWCDNIKYIEEELTRWNVYRSLTIICDTLSALGHSKSSLEVALLAVNEIEDFKMTLEHRSMYLCNYVKFNFRGYWENEVCQADMNSLIEGKNRIAKQSFGVFKHAFNVFVEASGFPISKVKNAEKTHHDDLYSMYAMMKSKRLAKYVKGASKIEDIFNHALSLINSVCASSGVNIEDSEKFCEDFRYSVANYDIDEIVKVIEDNKESLKGKSIILHRKPEKIAEFAKSGMSKMSLFLLFSKYGIDENPANADKDILCEALSVKDRDLWALDKSDIRNFTIGEITGCCQHIKGAGKYVCIDGWTDPYSINYVFGDKSEDKFYAHMWVWKAEDGSIIIDSIEGRSFVDAKSISVLVAKFAKSMKDKGSRVILSSTSYGLTKDVRKILKANKFLSDTIKCPESICDYRYMDLDPGDDCWEIIV